MGFSSIGQVLSHVERQPGWRDHRGYLALCQAWDELVGAGVAQHAQPAGYRGQVLYVAVSSAAWAQTLSFERRRLQEKIRASLPLPLPLGDIHFSTARWTELADRPRPWSGLAAPSPEAAGQATPAELATTPVVSAAEAFERWAKRARLHCPPPCPCCGKPTPANELARWGECNSCIIARQPRTKN